MKKEDAEKLIDLVGDDEYGEAIEDAVFETIREVKELAESIPTKPLEGGAIALEYVKEIVDEATPNNNVSKCVKDYFGRDCGYVQVRGETIVIEYPNKLADAFEVSKSMEFCAFTNNNVGINIDVAFLEEYDEEAYKKGVRVEHGKIS